MSATGAFEAFSTNRGQKNKRERVNAPSIENTSATLPTLSKTNEHIADFWLTTYQNLPLLMDPTSSFITAFSFNKTISLSPPIINTSKPYVNLYPVKFSSITNYCYSYSNTLLLKRSNFIFPSSEQIASDNIYFLVQASPQISSDNLPLLVIENMLNKHYKQSLIFHINLLFFAFPNCKYTTF